MKNITTALFSIGLFLCATLAFSQEKPENTENSRPIEKKFNELLESSNNFKQYEVVEAAKLIDLRNDTKAKIVELEKEIAVSQDSFESLKNEIGQTKAALTKTTAELKEATKAKEEIAFFGIPTNKTTYRTITWGLILLLVLALIIFVYKFKNSHSQTKEAKKNLRETDEEFEEYRKTALEKQQKLGRTLQDERNKSLRNTENRPS